MWLRCVPNWFPNLSSIIIQTRKAQVFSKASTCNAGDASSIPGQKDLLEKEMATHSNILAWEIPRTEELDGLQSTGWQGAGHSEHSRIPVEEGPLHQMSRG